MEQKKFPVFSVRFNELRGNMSQWEFGKKLGISRPTVGFYENGTRIPDALILLQIAERCDVSADWLLGLSDDPTRKGIAIDDLHLSAESVGIIKKYAPITKYRDMTVFDFLITHKQFEEIVLAINAIMSYTLRSEYGDFDISQSKGIHPLSVFRGVAPDEYKDAIDMMIKFFGRGSAFIGGKDILSFHGMLAKTAFDSLIESLIDNVSDEITLARIPK